MPNHYDPDQPRVPAGHQDGGQWTSGGHSEALISPPEGKVSGDDSEKSDSEGQADELISKPALLYRPPAPIKPGPGMRDAVTALFAWLSARNTPNRRAVLDFNSVEPIFKGKNKTFENVQLLDRKEAGKICDMLEEVQDATDKAVAEVQSKTPNLRFDNPAQYGMDVHSNIKERINKPPQPNFRAEILFHAAAASRPSKDVKIAAEGQTPDKSQPSRRVRLDVYEYKPEEKLVCIYEVKTGKDDMPSRTMVDYALAARKAFPDAIRYIVTQVRPTSEYAGSIPSLSRTPSWLERMMKYRVPNGN